MSQLKFEKDLGNALDKSLSTFSRFLRPVPSNCPWVCEDDTLCAFVYDFFVWEKRLQQRSIYIYTYISPRRQQIWVGQQV